MNPAAPVTQTFAISSHPQQKKIIFFSCGRGGPPAPAATGLLVGDAAAHPAFRRVQLGAVAGVRVELLLAELLVLRPYRKDALRLLRPLVAVVDRNLVGLAAADLLRKRQTGIPAAGSQAEGDHARSEE